MVSVLLGFLYTVNRLIFAFSLFRKNPSTWYILWFYEVATIGFCVCLYVTDANFSWIYKSMMQSIFKKSENYNFANITEFTVYLNHCWVPCCICNYLYFLSVIYSHYLFILVGTYMVKWLGLLTLNHLPHRLESEPGS